MVFVNGNSEAPAPGDRAAETVTREAVSCNQFRAVRADSTGARTRHGRPVGHRGVIGVALPVRRASSVRGPGVASAVCDGQGPERPLLYAIVRVRSRYIAQIG